MKIDGAPPVPPTLDQLLAASRASAGYRGGVTVACGQPPATSDVARPGVTAVLWTIRELGGGFHMPAVRPQHGIDACAAIIKATNADVCILLGLTHQPGWMPQADDGMIRMVAQEAGAGLAEARRILAALSAADPGAGWQLVPVHGADDKPAHAVNQSTCFLYKSGRGIAAGKAIVAATDAGLVAVLPVTVPDCFDCPPDVCFAAPLAVRARCFYASAPAGTAPTGVLPPDAVVAYSVPAGLAGNAHFAAFRNACEVAYAPPLAQGSRLKLPYWEQVALRDAGLLENFMAVAAADVLQQDSSMHCEALVPGVHPASLDDVSGKLADAVLLRHTSAAPAPHLAVARVVDLLRAVLDPDVLAALGASDPLPEDGCAAAMRARHAAPPVTSQAATAQARARNQLAAAILFARLLSDHWPILAQLRLQPSLDRDCP